MSTSGAMLAIYVYGLGSVNIIWKKSYIKNLKFWTILLPYKKVVTEKKTHVNNGGNLPNSCLSNGFVYPLINYPGFYYQKWL